MPRADWIWILACGLAGVFLCAVAAFSADLSSSTSNAPIGWNGFCERMPAECEPRGARIDAMRMSPERWRELIEVNNAVNATVIYRTDEEQHGVSELWSYPTSGFGDCEDYALEKRLRLMNLGWPSSTLLMTLVLSAAGGHAVLTVVTDQGHLVLDQLDPVIRSPSQTPYRYLARQSPDHPRAWIRLAPPPQL